MEPAKKIINTVVFSLATVALAIAMFWVYHLAVTPITSTDTTILAYPQASETANDAVINRLLNEADRLALSNSSTTELNGIISKLEYATGSCQSATQRDQIRAKIDQLQRLLNQSPATVSSELAGTTASITRPTPSVALQEQQLKLEAEKLAQLRAQLERERNAEYSRLRAAPQEASSDPAGVRKQQLETEAKRLAKLRAQLANERELAAVAKRKAATENAQAQAQLQAAKDNLAMEAQEQAKKQAAEEQERLDKKQLAEKLLAEEQEQAAKKQAAEAAKKQATEPAAGNTSQKKGRASKKATPSTNNSLITNKYVVQDGDNLTRISRKTHVPIGRLLEMNHSLSGNSTLQPGDTITIRR